MTTFNDLAHDFRKQYDLDLLHHRAYLRAKQEKNKLLDQINQIIKTENGGDRIVAGVGEFYYNKKLNMTTFVPEREKQEINNDR